MSTSIDFTGLLNYVDRLKGAERVEIDELVRFIAGLALELNEEHFNVTFLAIINLTERFSEFHCSKPIQITQLQ